jgi:hypothetical protein
LALVISSEKLDEIVLRTASERFGNRSFRRRALMDACKARLREMDYWASEDDLASDSSGPKSKGLANIDWATTRLGEAKKLLHVAHDEWKVA